MQTYKYNINKYKKFKIKKKNGKTRTIYSPACALKTYLRLENLKLSKRVESECDLDIAHGFIRGRSPVTNALKHRGYKFTLSVDLKDFFDTVKGSMIDNLTNEQKQYCFVKENISKIKTKKIRHGRYIPDQKYIEKSPQGFPTSPALSNLACIKLDEHLKQWCEKRDVIYTRYADDLTFSCNNVEMLKMLKGVLPRILSRYGFTINPKKTRIQSSCFGRREITGIMVDDEIHIPRGTKRKLRASIHQQNKNQIHGFQEWQKLKTPNANSNKLTRSDFAYSRWLGRKLANVPNKWD